MRYLLLIILLCLALTLVSCNESAQEESVIPEGITNARGLTDAAIQKQQIGAFAEALEILSKAVEVDPDSPAAHYLLGQALDRLQQHEEAERHLRRALGLDPSFVEASTQLGKTLLRQGRTEAAKEQAQRVLAIDPSNGWARKTLRSRGAESE